MVEPPPGYIDMLADAEDAPYSDVWADLLVPDVGVVVARRPRPNAIPILAMAVNPDCSEAQQFDYSTQFIQAHIADGEWERLNDAMMDDALPADTIQSTARAVAAWGTARPYTAVVALALQTAHIWRTVRLSFIEDGHQNPMLLPHMHIVLDKTERFVVEAKGEDERNQYYEKLYSVPVARQVRTASGRRRILTPPPGFSPEEVNASWKAWTSSAGAAG